LCLQENQEKMRTPEEGVSTEGETDHCLVLAHSHYVVSGSIGVTAQVQKPWPIIVDTGSGFNVIRRSALPDGWKKFITASNDLPTLGDANGNALVVQHQVLLRVRLGNALYRVLFYVVDHLACPVLLGTQFANRHIEAIRCIKGEIEFTRDTLPIIGRGSRVKPWQVDGERAKEIPTLAGGQPAKDGDDTEQLTKIRLVRPIVLKPYTQHRVQVSTLLQGVIVTEPKNEVMRRFGCRVMNSVHEVRAGQPFELLMTNFSAHPRRFPKGMVIAYASRSPVVLIHVGSKTANELVKEHCLSQAVDDMQEEIALERLSADVAQQMMHIIDVADEEQAYRRVPLLHVDQIHEIDRRVEAEAAAQGERQDKTNVMRLPKRRRRMWRLNQA